MAQYEDEENECVVYYDLDAESRSRSLLRTSKATSISVQSPVEVIAATKGVRELSGHQIFPRQHTPLFNLDDSEDEATEGKNPFESLLQQQTQTTTKSVELIQEKASSREIAERSHGVSLVTAVNGIVLNEKIGQEAISKDSKTFKSSCNEDNLYSTWKHSQQANELKAIANTKSTKKLGFEAADLRPVRWSTRKVAPSDTKNRRKSLNAISKRRSQLETSIAKRRKSMPMNLSDSRVAHNQASLNDRPNATCSLSNGRLLSNVLHRATLLSQRQQTASDETLLAQGIEGNYMDGGDAILDTEHHMQAEEFVPHVFSPVKPASTTTALSRKLKDDVVVSKIRGGIGDVIRKATRKSNRELTLLRSHKQHLFPQHGNHSPRMTFLGLVESIQNRAYIEICLTRYCGTLSHFAAYECHVHQVTAKLKKPTADELKEKHSIVLEAQFHPRTAEYLKLSPGKLLRVFEPLHFLLEHVAAGSVSKVKWFLVSTQLTQVLEGNHQCAERHL
ncbi:unnamed protein product [Peronospora belbahrii]|uniref:Uncharacterized protein n=1 Tax=Peronospora belbahrii TaxID=622444 RepID=A0AAU9KRW3_9STRA|nr:unnamed protein product [Peronospora belbahrii]